MKTYNQKKVSKFNNVWKFYHAQKFNIRFQFTFLSRIKSKVFIMLLCSFVAAFFALVASLMPSLGMNVKKAELSSVEPFKSYSQYGQYDRTKDDRDPYISDAPILEQSKSFIDYKTKFGIKMPYESFDVPSNSATGTTFNYDDFTTYPDYFNINPLFLPQGSFSDVNRVSSNYYNEEDYLNCIKVTTYMTSILADISLNGLGGLLFDSRSLDALTFLDDFAWFNYVTHTNKDDPKTYVFDAPWMVSRKFSKVIASILLKGPVNTATGIAIFSKYVSNDNTSENLSISNVLSDLFGFFSPYFIKNNISTQHKEINDEYTAAYKKAQTNDGVITLSKNFEYYYNENKTNPVYLSFGSVPYNKAKGDELYTSYPVSTTKGGYTIRGIDYNSKLWLDKNKPSLTELDNDNAYVTKKDALKMRTGSSPENAIPVIANRTAISKNKFLVGEVFAGNAKRVAYKDYNDSNDDPQRALSKWNDKTYFQVVGEAHNLGSAEFYTSRQEINMLALSPPKFKFENNSISNVVANNDPTIEYNFDQPQAFSKDSSQYGNIQKYSAAYGDDNGFFNSVLYSDAYNPAMSGLILESNGNYLLTGGFNFQYGIQDAFSGTIVEKTVSNVLYFFMIFGYSISGILLALASVLFVLSQRIILVGNKKNTKVLKTMGYSNLKIQWLLSSFYIITGLIFSLGLIGFYKPIAYMVLKLFGNLLSFNTYIPVDHFSVLTLCTYFGVIFLFYTAFIILSIRGVRKDKPVDREDL